MEVQHSQPGAGSISFVMFLEFLASTGIVTIDSYTHLRCGWQDGLASRRRRRLQSGRRDYTSISTTGVLRSRLNLEVLSYEPSCRASDGDCPVVSAFIVQFKCLPICRVWRRIPAHFRLHYSELAEKTNVTAEDVNPTSRWVEF